MKLPVNLNQFFLILGSKHSFSQRHFKRRIVITFSHHFYKPKISQKKLKTGHFLSTQQGLSNGIWIKKNSSFMIKIFII